MAPKVYWASAVVQSLASKPYSRTGWHGRSERGYTAAVDADTLARYRECRAAAVQRIEVETAEDYAALVDVAAAHTPLTELEEARVPAVVGPGHQSRRAAGEAAVGYALALEAVGPARGVETAAAAAAAVQDTGPVGEDLGSGAAKAARVAAEDTRGIGAAGAQMAARAAAVDAAVGGGAAAARAVAGRGDIGAMDGQQQEGERETTVFWSPCPYRHATVKAASYYLPPSPFGSTGIVRCGQRALTAAAKAGRMIRSRQGTPEMLMRAVGMTRRWVVRTVLLGSGPRSYTAPMSSEFRRFRPPAEDLEREREA